jgi:hypothetical protein
VLNPLNNTPLHYTQTTVPTHREHRSAYRLNCTGYKIDICWRIIRNARLHDVAKYAVLNVIAGGTYSNHQALNGKLGAMKLRRVGKWR